MRLRSWSVRLIGEAGLIGVGKAGLIVSVRLDWGTGDKRERERWEWEAEMREWGEWERKNYKIINAKATVALHICTVTVAIVHKCTILDKLMWCFFRSKCVKRFTFSILQNYPQCDVNALRWYVNLEIL